MPGEVRFGEVRNILERHGWQLVRIRGSHHVFEKRGYSNIVLPVHNGKVLPIYVRKIEKILKGDRPSV